MVRNDAVHEKLAGADYELAQALQMIREETDRIMKALEGITMFEEIKKLLFRKRKPRPEPKPDPEQEREDEEQAAYLAEWSRRHNRRHRK